MKKIPTSAKIIFGVAFFLGFSLIAIELVPQLFVSTLEKSIARECNYKTRKISFPEGVIPLDASGENLFAFSESSILVFEIPSSASGAGKLSLRESISVVCPSGSTLINCLPSKFEEEDVHWKLTNLQANAGILEGLIEMSWGKHKRILPVIKKENETLRIGAPIGVCGRYLTSAPKNSVFVNSSLILSEENATRTRLHVYQLFPFHSGLIRESARSADSVYEFADDGRVRSSSCQEHPSPPDGTVTIAGGEDHLVVGFDRRGDTYFNLYSVRDTDLALKQLPRTWQNPIKTVDRWYGESKEKLLISYRTKDGLNLRSLALELEADSGQVFEEQPFEVGDGELSSVIPIKKDKHLLAVANMGLSFNREYRLYSTDGKFRIVGERKMAMLTRPVPKLAVQTYPSIWNVIEEARKEFWQSTITCLN